MDSTKSDDSKPVAPVESTLGVNRRQFLGTAAAAAGGMLLGGAPAIGQTGQKFTEWGWPQPYDQISAKSKAWLQSKGWWPINAGWIVVWSGEEMIGNILQQEKLLEKRGIDVKWQTFVAAGFSNEAFIPAVGQAGGPRRHPIRVDAVLLGEVTGFTEQTVDLVGLALIVVIEGEDVCLRGHRCVVGKHELAERGKYRLAADDHHRVLAEHRRSGADDPVEALAVHRDPARRNFDCGVTSSRSWSFSSVVNGDIFSSSTSSSSVDNSNRTMSDRGPSSSRCHVSM